MPPCLPSIPSSHTGDHERVNGAIEAQRSGGTTVGNRRSMTQVDGCRVNLTLARPVERHGPPAPAEADNGDTEQGLEGPELGGTVMGAASHTVVADREALVREILSAFGLAPGAATSGVAFGGRFAAEPGGPELETVDPTTGAVLARVPTAAEGDCTAAVGAAHAAFQEWRSVPAPRRGEVVRRLGDAFRARKEDLARLVSLENGKILSEARGEVQEVIDICDFAVGLSRQLYGRQMHSERPEHRLLEQWHPLGVVGIISAFNFPLAVPGWGWAIALVCGDAIAWKPSSLTPLVSIAAQQVFHDVTAGTEAEGVFSLVIGSGGTVGEALLADPRLPLIQATGSCALGERVSTAVGRRAGRA